MCDTECHKKKATKCNIQNDKSLQRGTFDATRFPWSKRNHNQSYKAIPGSRAVAATSYDTSNINIINIKRMADYSVTSLDRACYSAAEGSLFSRTREFHLLI